MNVSVSSEKQHVIIPSKYWIWLTGATFASLGTQILGFAMAWTAAGYGGVLAGLVLTVTNLPRALLLLLGGTVVDRLGAWRVMISGDAAMTAITAMIAVALLAWGPSPWLLVVAAFLTGVVDAFYMPATGSMPRRLVSDSHLAQAMSARQISGQLASVLGGPIGASIVGAFGIAAAAIADSATFAGMFILLIFIRPHGSSPAIPQPSTVEKSSVVQEALSGLRLSSKDPLLRPGLLMLIGSAAFLLPVLSLLLPVLARQSGWEPIVVGLVYGLSAASAAAVAISVLVTGGLSRPGIAGASGLALAAVGVFALAVAPNLATTITAGVVVGLGTGLFSTHIGPLILGRTPDTHIGRVQSVVAMAQIVPLLVTNFSFGALAQFAGAKTTLVLGSVSLFAVAAIALRSKQLRQAERFK